MIDRAHLCTELTATWHRDIPLAAATQIGIESYDGHTLAVRAPLAPNRNLHGTAGVEQLAAKGRATFDVACAIESDGKRAVSFTAAYVVHA